MGKALLGLVASNLTREYARGTTCLGSAWRFLASDLQLHLDTHVMKQLRFVRTCVEPRSFSELLINSAVMTLNFINNNQLLCFILWQKCQNYFLQRRKTITTGVTIPLNVYLSAHQKWVRASSQLCWCFSFIGQIHFLGSFLHICKSIFIQVVICGSETDVFDIFTLRS